MAEQLLAEQLLAEQLLAEQLLAEQLLAEQLLERGDRVAGTARKPDALDDLKTKYGGQLWVRALDLTDTADSQRVVGAAFQDLGRIDVVVSNAAPAGAGRRAHLAGLVGRRPDRLPELQLVSCFGGSLVSPPPLAAYD